ncbi:MAG: transglutaminase domain-containing protein [Planctomycetota bacterium]|nr:MAG: transglutaminase domain-containing protein [Planctomycetota bacterium]
MLSKQALMGCAIGVYFFLSSSLFSEQSKGCCPPPAKNIRKAASKERCFSFLYQVSFASLPAKGKLLRVWVPVPQSNENQVISHVRVQWPGTYRFTRDRKYGNKILYAQLKLPYSKPFSLRLSFVVRRQSIAPKFANYPKSPAKLSDYLAPNSKVPVGHKKIRSHLHQAKVEKFSTPMQKARAVYDYIIDQLRYDKSGIGWGRGDALWACDNKRGNCTDYHSLFISMMRTLKIPARFEIGFPLPENKTKGEIRGYHCWGYFYIQKLGWVPVDISEADKHPKKKEFFFGGLDAHRVAFSVGRDIELVPPSQERQNFFIYPVVELDQRPYKEYKRRFYFSDLSLKVKEAKAPSSSSEGG